MKSEKSNEKGFCSCFENFAAEEDASMKEMMNKCYSEMGSFSWFGDKADEKVSMSRLMNRCMKACKKGGKWFLAFTGIFLISIFLLTFFLNPETVRILWLVITGLIIGMGTIFLIMIIWWTNSFKNSFKS